MALPVAVPQSPSELVSAAVSALGGDKVSSALSQLYTCHSTTASVTGAFYTVTGRKVARCGASLTVVSDCAYFFGGRGANDACRASLYAVDLRGRGASRIKTAESVSPREGAVVLAYRGTLVVIGGCESQEEQVVQLRDVQVCSLQTKQWTPLATSGEAPSGRSYHAAGLIGDCAVLYGGKTDHGADESAYMLSLASGEWRKVVVEGCLPGKRHSTAFTTAQDRLFIFGGSACDQFLPCSDLFAFTLLSPSSLFCSQLPSPTTGPAARCCSTLTSISPQTLVLFAGVGPTGVLSDVWLYHLSLRCWSCVAASPPVPGRLLHSACAYNNKAVVFGGLGIDGVPTSDFVVFDIMLATDVPEPVSPAPAAMPEVRTKCGNCGHDQSACRQSDAPYGFSYPALSYFSQVVPPLSILSELEDQRRDPYFSLLSLCTALGGQEVVIDVEKEWLVVSTDTGIDAPALVAMVGGRGRGLVRSLGKSIGVVSKTDRLTTIAGVDGRDTYTVVLDKDGKTLYPDIRIYHDTVRKLSKLFPFALSSLQSLPHCTTAAVRNAAFVLKSHTVVPLRPHCCQTLPLFLQSVYHHAPATQRFTVHRIRVEPVFVSNYGPPKTTERTGDYILSTYDFHGNLRVYYRNRSVYVGEVKRCAVVLTLLSPVFMHTEEIVNLQAIRDLLVV